MNISSLSAPHWERPFLACQAARHDVTAKVKRSSTLMAVIEKAKPLPPMVESYAL